MADLRTDPGVLPPRDVPGATTGTVVVGYDATPEAGLALDWAADWAELHRSRLMVACAVDPVLSAGPGSASGPDVPTLRRAVDRVASQGVEHVRPAHPGLDVRSIGAVGHPSAELVALSGEADLVVVGRRTRLENPAASVGSVSFALSAHARCPVVVVQGQRRLGQGRPVVVGVDASRPSMRAVAFAAAAATAARTDLVLVSAWSGRDVVPWLDELWGGLGHGPDRVEAELERATWAVDEAERFVRQSHPGIRTTRRTPRAHETDALLAESQEAGLLVVGARGGGGFAGLLLGSVSRGVLRRADLPVAVVRSGAL
ncbi:universal stress protein [Knoellia flava]|uniref:Universal stress protein n=1 Tax=Knoellia flava TaxID=913969 RepID=A0A8H9FPF6_9MICO|nr:universal stress protein [Knoellia flava]GGB65401.1 universal stress protein [Knoellia flava]